MIAVPERGMGCKVDFAVIVKMITPETLPGSTSIDARLLHITCVLARLSKATSLTFCKEAA